MKTTTEILIENCDNQIAVLQRLKNTFTAHRDLFDQIGSGSVGCKDSFMVFIHSSVASDKCKDLCRAIGGEWQREYGSNGVYNYRQEKNQVHWIIFNAEQREIPTTLSL